MPLSPYRLSFLLGLVLPFVLSLIVGERPMPTMAHTFISSLTTGVVSGLAFTAISLFAYVSRDKNIKRAGFFFFLSAGMFVASPFERYLVTGIDLPWYLGHSFVAFMVLVFAYKCLYRYHYRSVSVTE